MSNTRRLKDAHACMRKYDQLAAELAATELTIALLEGDPEAVDEIARREADS